MSVCISAVICTYNRSESLRHTVIALKNQAVPAGVTLEIIVVDNNSTDDTRQVVGREAQGSVWPIRYVFESRQGLCYARNTGIQQANGELIIFTDDDVLPQANWIQALSDAFVRYEADSVGGKILPLWIHEPPAWLMAPECRKTVWGALALLDRGPNVLIGGPKDANLIYGANMAFRKAALQQVGMFRTDLGPQGTQLLRGDDTDMVGRFLKAGKRMVYTPHAVVYHRVPVHRMRLSYLRRWKMQGGQTAALLLRSTFGASPRLPKWLLRECAVNGARALWAYVTGQRHRGIGYELECLGHWSTMMGLLKLC